MRLRIGNWSAVGESVDLRCRADDVVRESTRERDGGTASSRGSAADRVAAEATRTEAVPDASSAETVPDASSAETVTDATLAARIAAAISTAESVPLRTEGPEAREPVEVDVDCAAPAPAHEPLRVHPADGSLRSILAAAARSRGLPASVDAAIADRRETLRELAVPDVDLDAARERLAAATGEEDRLGERVAALRGELRAHRELDADVEAVREELADATTALSAAETERIAAEQALARAVDRARDARDARERRLELEDEIANLERDARRELAAEVSPDVRDALAVVPGADPELAGDPPESFASDVASVALAAVRVAALEAPVVLGPSVDRFESAGAARDVLDCPVIRV